MRILKGAILAAVLLFAAAYGAAQLFLHRTPGGAAQAEPAAAAQADAALIARGEYVARAGDCVACHTGPGSKPFAGGLRMETPIGAVFSTNITPDPETGIGKYSYDDFVRAVKHGVAPGRRALYPAMPYPSYAVVTDEDLRAMYAYFMRGVEPVRQENAASTIPWPLGIRWPLAFWQALFARPGAFAPDPTRDAAWNRGAYLVQGLAHCGTCHTPRGLAFQEKSLNDREGDLFLAGAVIDGWYAKSLRGEMGSGLGRWSADNIVEFLKTGRTERSAAFGSMAEVITHSTQYLDKADLAAIAGYLKSLPPAKDDPHLVNAQDLTLEELRSGVYRNAGAATYVEFCVACHRMDGAGHDKVFPALAQNSVVLSDRPESLIRITLEGGTTPKTEGAPMAFGMPGFPQLSDKEIADVLTFIRSSWGNHAPPVSERDVARSRNHIERAGK